MEDALAATKAAVEEGIVAGGGTALVNAIPQLKSFATSLTEMKRQELRSSLEHSKSRYVRLHI